MKALFLPLRHQGTKKNNKDIICVFVPLWQIFFDLVPIYSNPIIFAKDLFHSRIEYLRDSAD